MRFLKGETDPVDLRVVALYLLRALSLAGLVVVFSCLVGTFFQGRGQAGSFLRFSR